MNENAKVKYQTINQTRPIGILLPKLFLVLTIIFLLWIIIVASGVFILEMDPFWAGLSLGMWAIVVSILVAIFIVLDSLFLIKPSLGLNETMEFVESDRFNQPEFVNGKRVYEFTFPQHAKGGVFSKTYLQIHNDFLLRVRNQMFTESELWKKKKDDDSNE